MKKLALVLALFSSFTSANALPGLEVPAAPSAAVTPDASATTPAIDAKTLAQEAKTALVGMKNYSDEKSGYSIDYPAAWQLKEFEAPICFKVYSHNGKINVNSAYEAVPPDVTARATNE